MEENTEQPSAGAEESTAVSTATPETPSADGAEDEGLLSEATLTAEEVEELEEIEHEGKKAKVPKELKDAFMRHSDYTRKTQEVAEQRREIEERGQRVQALGQMQQQLGNEFADIRNIDQRLQQFSQVNMQQLVAQNPQQAILMQAEIAQLQAYRSQLTGSITHKQQQMQLAQQQDTATRASKAEAYLKREIKDWSSTKDVEMRTYAQGLGIDTQRLSQFVLHEPAIVRALDKAAKFDQLMKKQFAKTPAAPAQPVTRISPKDSPASKDPDKMTSDEWRKWREEQVAKRKKR